MQVLNDLKTHNVKDILICCVDGLKGFPEAIEAVFPQTTVQTCIVHLIRQSLRYVPRRQYDAVVKDLSRSTPRATPIRPSWRSMPSRKSGGSSCRSSGKRGGTRRKSVVPFMAFPDEVRRVVYTTNAIEALNRQLRKTIKTKGSFPSRRRRPQAHLPRDPECGAAVDTDPRLDESLLAFKIQFGERLPD